jgi:hypothetical protein
LLALKSQVVGLSRTVDAIRTMMEEHRVEGRREFQMLNANIRRVAIQPIIRQANNSNEEAGAAAVRNETLYAHTLSPNPRTLYILWEEYENGIGGRMAASLFTSQERGRVKHKYHRRKAVWDCISALVRAGFTARVAIDRIYTVYGIDTPVTSIINQLKRDRRTGNLHLSLQI